MNDCFLRKLKGTFDNSDLLKVGEIRFKALTDNAVISFQFSDSNQQTATAISGTITQTWKNKVLTVTAGSIGTIFSLPDKYKISVLNTSAFAIVGNDIEILDCSPIGTIILDGIYGSYDDENKVSGDITTLLENAKSTIGFINLRNQKVYGSLSPLADNNTLRVLYMTGANVSGQLDDIVNSLIRIIDLTYTQVSGNLSDIAACTSLTELQLPEGVNGDVGSLHNLNALTYFNCFGVYSGDLSQIGSAVTGFVSHNGGTFSWTSRATTSTIFSIGRNTNYLGNPINLGNSLDTFLGNIVNCTMPSRAVKINVAGTESGNTATLAAALKTKISSQSGSTLTVNGTSY